MRMLTIRNGQANKRVGLRLVVIIFLVTFLSGLPQGGLPTLLDLYKALLASGITALLVLERSEAAPPDQPGNPSNGGNEDGTKIPI